MRPSLEQVSLVPFRPKVTQSRLPLSPWFGGGEDRSPFRRVEPRIVQRDDVDGFNEGEIYSNPHGIIRLSEDLSLPAEAVTQTFAILAKRGVGKTWTTLLMVEEMARAKLPVVTIDPVGAHWGLARDADGNGRGIGALVLGGDHGDEPLPVDSGRTVAARVLEETRPVVLDLCHLRRDDQAKFSADFLEEVYFRKGKDRRPLHIAVDEADLLAPQRPDDAQKRTLGAMEDVVRRGRSRGLGCTLVTQRPSVISKNVLTQAEVLVVLRMTAPQDRAAVDEWVKMNGEADKRDRLLSSLASLPVGTAWFWSPGWLDVFRKVKIRGRSTFDSSSTPVVKVERDEHAF
jgi:uncharacterized protein